MKTLIGLLALTCLAATLRGQATVSFRNNVPFASPGDRLVYSINGTPLVGTQYVAQLYYGTYGAPAESLVPVAAAPVPFRVATTASPGTWSGGTRTLEGITTPQVATLQVRVWDLSLFSTYQAAVAAGGLRGESVPFRYDPEPLGYPGPSWFMEYFRGFTLVPEPSVIALTGLGALALLAYRASGSTSRGSVRASNQPRQPTPERVLREIGSPELGAAALIVRRQREISVQPTTTKERDEQITPQMVQPDVAACFSDSPGTGGFSMLTAGEHRHRWEMAGEGRSGHHGVSRRRYI